MGKLTKLSGFIDSHLHMLGLGYTKSNISLEEAKSKKEVISLLKKSQSKTIIIGKGWNQEEFIYKKFLTKADLNKVSLTIPVIAIRICGHVLVVNDAMLKLAKIDNNKGINGGSFDINTGIFKEKAMDLIYNKIPIPNKNDLKEYFIKANKIMLENGITSVASDDFSIFPISYEEIISVINELYKENLIQVKITEQVNISIDELRSFIKKGYVNKRFVKFKLGPLKIIADGSLGGKTAALREPYMDDANNLGIKLYTDIELFEKVYLADSFGMDVVIHAIGDTAINQAINAIIKSLKITKRKNHHHALIHAQLATKSQIKLMKEWNIGAIVQPIFLNTDISIVKSRIGSRYKESYLFKTMYNLDLKVGFSTDSPIEPINPFYNLYTAIHRKSIKNNKLQPLLLEEAFELKEALDCYTKNNLHYIYEDKQEESDYIIIDRPLNKNDLLNTNVLKTYIDGILVYNKIK